MKVIGYSLAALALILALLTFMLQRWGGQEAAEIAVACFGVTVLAAALMFAVSAIVRLARGQVKIRPWDAARKTGLLFLIVFGIRALIELIVPDWQDDMILAALQSAGFAVVYGLYTTAYRKPA